MAEIEEREELIVPEAELAPEVVPMQGGVFLPEDPEKYLRDIEDALDFQKRFHVILLKKANPETELVKLGDGKHMAICPTNNCRVKWARVAGGSIMLHRDENGDPKVIRREFTDNKGRNYFGYEAFATCTDQHGNRFDGSALITSRHKFFGKEGIYDGEGNRIGTKLKDPDDVDEAHVRQAAITYSISHAIDLRLGMTRLTADQLAQAGVDISRIGGYRFERKSKGVQSKSTADSEDKKQPKFGGSSKRSTANRISEDQKQELIGFCNEHKIPHKHLLGLVGGFGRESLSEIRKDELPKLRKELELLIA